MNEQMKTLGQIFYGRGPDGYGVLGASPAGRPFVGVVASLCRAVGSPDRPDDIPTFLLGEREGDSAIMVRACRGAADPTGRATIFFHALVADVDSLRSAGLDAFAFADTGTFSSSCSGREPPDLVFPDVQIQTSVQSSARMLDLPATISSDQPLDKFVRRELGAESLDRSWATFSYNPLPDFDLCVLSSYSPRSGGGTQYAFDGAGLHRLSPEPAPPKTIGSSAVPTEKRSSSKSSSPLFLSLAANAVLVLALLLHVGKHTEGQKADIRTVNEMTESDARAKWEAKWKSEWKASLPPLVPAMTESEAKGKWWMQWKAEWEKSLPPPEQPMTEAEALSKWETQWKAEWEKSLRKEFEIAFQHSGGKWPIVFDNDDSPFVKSIRDAQKEPDDERASARWKLYRSCKACAEFIQTHLNPNP